MPARIKRHSPPVHDGKHDARWMLRPLLMQRHVTSTPAEGELRAEWTWGGVSEKFSDYVSKGIKKVGA